MQWSSSDVKAWIVFTVQHFNLPMVPAEYFAMDGAALIALTEDEFNQRAPQVSFFQHNANYIYNDYLCFKTKTQLFIFRVM